MRSVDDGSDRLTETVKSRRTAKTALMRVSIFAPTIARLIIGPASADVFVPPGGAPDYVVTYVIEAGSDVRKPRTKIVFHHGAWTRIEQSDGASSFITYVGKSRLIIQQSRPNNPTSVASFSEEWGERQDDGRWQTDARRTTEQRLVAGEPCTVWLIRHFLQEKLEQKSCITEDGIEVASFIETDRGASMLNEAVKVERRALRAEDVTPPRQLFDPAFWFKQAELQANATNASTELTPNDEVRLRRSDERRPSASSDIIEVRRRYGTATSIMTLKSDGGWQHEFTFGNRLLFVFQGNVSGLYENFRVIHSTGQDGRINISQEPDVILGENCVWYNDKPGMMDASYVYCETWDSVVLKSVPRSRSHLNEMTAQSLRRGANQPADFSLPRDLSDKSEWLRSKIGPHDHQ